MARIAFVFLLTIGSILMVIFTPRIAGWYEKRWQAKTGRIGANPYYTGKTAILIWRLVFATYVFDLLIFLYQGIYIYYIPHIETGMWASLYQFTIKYWGNISTIVEIPLIVPLSYYSLKQILTSDPSFALFTVINNANIPLCVYINQREVGTIEPGKTKYYNELLASHAMYKLLVKTEDSVIFLEKDYKKQELVELSWNISIDENPPVPQSV